MKKKKKPNFPPEVLEFFRRHGKIGGAKGGAATAANRTPEERSAHAQKAVAGRKWHPMLTDEERARRAALPKRPVGRPRKVVEEPAPKRQRGRPRKTGA